MCLKTQGAGWVTDISAASSQRLVKRIVERTYLQVLGIPVPEEFLDQNVVFFLRNTKGASWRV